jgi:hypothetical protein
MWINAGEVQRHIAVGYAIWLKANRDGNDVFSLRAGMGSTQP